MKFFVHLLQINKLSQVSKFPLILIRRKIVNKVIGCLVWFQPWEFLAKLTYNFLHAFPKKLFEWAKSSWVVKKCSWAFLKEFKGQWLEMGSIGLDWFWLKSTTSPPECKGSIDFTNSVTSHTFQPVGFFYYHNCSTHSHDPKFDSRVRNKILEPNLKRFFIDKNKKMIPCNNANSPGLT